MKIQGRQDTKSLQIKDLVTIGIFTALLFIAIGIGAAPFAPNPFLTFYMPLGGALLGGPIFLLLTAKVPKRGAVSIVGLLISAVIFATGMHWAMALGYLLGGILGDLIAGSREYRSIKCNSVAYTSLVFGATGTYIAYFVNPEAWARQMLKGDTTITYIDIMGKSAHSWTLPVILIGTVLVALFSAYIGAKLLKKQFEKAGITS
ncbi:MAG: MptD family putative ECF transporter S component [Bacillota bacterium]|nr:MptD family putative ECF transporter S component [Bacillota bacterium]